MPRAASWRFGVTSSSRAPWVGSSSASSYWPSTWRPMKPTIPPISPASSMPPAARSGPASGPVAARRTCSTSGSSVPRIVRRFAFAQVVAVDRLGRRQLVARARGARRRRRARARRRAIASRSPGSGFAVSPFGEPATAPATRSARSSRSRVGRPLEVGCGQGGELGERRLGARRDDGRSRLRGRAARRAGRRTRGRRRRRRSRGRRAGRPRRRPRGSSTARPCRRRGSSRPGTARSRSSRSRGRGR